MAELCLDLLGDLQRYPKLLAGFKGREEKGRCVLPVLLMQMVNTIQDCLLIGNFL